MAEFTPGLFEDQFAALLDRHAGPLGKDARRLIARLVEAAVNRHSCIELGDEDTAGLDELYGLGLTGSLGPPAPFVRQGPRLYLSRYYRYEREVVNGVTARNLREPLADPAGMKDRLDEQFTDNRQKLAALLVMTRKLAIITGGPGTGKTSTVVRILDLLLSENSDLDVRLAAPTGKAAKRLEESIARLDLPVQTIHRLLGMRRDGKSWRHGPQNPIDPDLLIIDEASMIDLTLMHRLLRALSDKTRLVLLGDPDQLPSVDTGNVLADLCAGEAGFTRAFADSLKPFVGDLPIAGRRHKLTDAICQLDRNYRFATDSAIARLAAAIRDGDGQLPPPDPTVTVKPAAGQAPALAEHWPKYMALLREGCRQPGPLLAAFDDCRILCSRRGGTTGVEPINRELEKQLTQAGLRQAGSDFYAGRPVLVTQNDYQVELFNGDVGICLPDSEGDQVFFPGAEGPLPVPASRLPTHETCFAMTVHKAQGSEFPQVVLMLSEETSDEATSLMTRELLYTAVTRAKQTITLCCDADVWRAAVQRKSARVSGMTAFLGSDDAG